MTQEKEITSISENDFCKYHTEFHGEVTDKVGQIVSQTFTGEELLEFTSFVAKQEQAKSLANYAKELPSDKEIQEDFMYSNLWGGGAKWMRSKASEVIANLDEAILKLAIECDKKGKIIAEKDIVIVDLKAENERLKEYEFMYKQLEK